MRIQQMTYLDVTLVSELRARAEKAGVSMSKLMELTCRYGLDRLSDDALAKWAQTQSPGRANLLTKNERAVLRAIDEIKKTTGAWRPEVTDIAGKAGLTMKFAYMALVRLQSRGLVHPMAMTGLNGRPTEDQWGRDTNTAWCLVSDREKAKRGERVVPEFAP